MKRENIRFGWGNSLYMIVWYNEFEDEVYVDHTTSIIELNEMLSYHDTASNKIRVFKIDYDKSTIPERSMNAIKRNSRKTASKRR